MGSKSACTGEFVSKTKHMYIIFMIFRSRVDILLVNPDVSVSGSDGVIRGRRNSRSEDTCDKVRK